MCGTKHRRSRYHGYFPGIQISNTYREEVTHHIQDGLLYCFNCDKTFNTENIKFCNNCGGELLINPISRNNLRTGNRFAQCPRCNTLFHYHHLTNWLENDDRCPNCRESSDSIVNGTVGVNFIN